MSLSADTSLAGAWQMLLGLTLVMGLLAAAAWALKRLQSMQMRDGRVIKILGSVGAGPGGRIMVVEIDGLRLVVGITPSRMDVLATLQAAASPPECGGPGGRAASFPDRLKSSAVVRDDA
ncbi:MAG: FliO/MopB family protein [Candidatus Methylumidiphilus sp.]